MFPSPAARHASLMRELEAREARQSGITSAEVVTPSREKPSIGKILFFLAGVGAVCYFVLRDDSHPFEDALKAFGKKEDPKPKDESRHLISQIKFHQEKEMEELIAKYQSAKKLPSVSGEEKK